MAKYIILVIAFLAVMTGAILKINHSTVYGNALLTAGMLSTLVWIITITRKIPLSWILVKLRWYFLLCAAGVLCMGILVKTGGYPNHINSFIGAGVNIMLFLVSLFIRVDKKHPQHG